MSSSGCACMAEVAIRNNNKKLGVLDFTDGIPIVTTRLRAVDWLFAVLVRLGAGRMDYRVLPQLYAVGNPKKDSVVLVTANYKLTFDTLRRELSGVDCWILVLDTDGINVWCAAGKGSFGTEELIRRIESVDLKNRVDHRRLILPQLGATGVSATEVQKKSGFSVLYGPVRAEDIKAYLSNGLQKTPEMRRVRFNIFDRLILTPMELVGAWMFYLAALAFSWLTDFLRNGTLTSAFIPEFLRYVGAVVIGGFVVPLALPWIPFQSFALKGALLGGLYSAGVIVLSGFGVWESIASFLIWTAIASFTALNFTGSTTFTSLSGAQKEVKISLPIYIVGGVIGLTIKVLSSLKIL